MKCSICFSEQADGSRFCQKCGASVQQESFQQSQYDQQAPMYGQSTSYGQSQYGQSASGDHQQYQQPYQNQYQNQYQQYQQQQQYAYQQQQNNYEIQAAQKKATNSLIYSIIGFLCCFPFAIAGLIMGLNAKKELERLGMPAGNATGGIIIGAIVCILQVLSLILYIVVFAIELL